MSRSLDIIFIAGLLVLGVWWWTSENEDPVPTSIEQPALVEEQVEKPVEKMKPPKLQEPKLKIRDVSVKENEIQGRAVSARPADEGKTDAPQWPEGTVEFKVMEEKYAVAFGDIILGVVPEDKRDIKSAYFEPPASRLWPSNVIPYAVSEGVEVKPAIEAAIAHFHQNTPVRFVPFDNDEDAIVFVPAKERCASQLGRTGGQQAILVAPLCGENEIIHELMHALGFVHEHSREDRDRYLEVLWDNIKPEYWLQFQMVPDSWVHEYRGSVFNFDPESIMLYPPNAFAKTPDLLTLKSKSNMQLRPSQQGLSRLDKERVFYLYGSR